LVGARAPRSYTWRCGPHLNQGAEGACVGFAFAHELAARPVPVADVTNEMARSIYFDAQRIDPWPGGAYPGASPTYEGTSVLAGVQIVQRMGRIPEYRWAFGADELAAAVSWNGPAVIGVDWMEGMFDTDANGYVHPTGAVLGGHAILVHGYNVSARRFQLRNSWGSRWGKNGGCYLSHADMQNLLSRQWADACCPIRRA
ncbi:MAG TPA: C1 family peptidase, partial [Chloroflexota bacterium]|nr:C1 family peptidase [Chloroflexota bacterium]